MQLNRRFFTFHKKKRPYIILKWAQSADAFLDIERADDLPTINWISNNKSKRLVHTWRAEESAILVGKNTVLKDNPSLTTREVAGPNPIRILIDGANSLFSEASETKKWKIFSDDAPTIVYNKLVSKIVGSITFVKIDTDRSMLAFILDDLYQRDILSVIVEGGRFTLNQFIEHDLWDEARVIRGLPYFKKGVKAPDLQLSPFYTEIIGGDHIDYFVHS
jgi:diaminohydroxyphosphoribosylaminopyrimidine deaminase/5-amino-6-(5-phosphoribosylamino)uracil reductase